MRVTIILIALLICGISCSKTNPEQPVREKRTLTFTPVMVNEIAFHGTDPYICYNTGVILLPDGNYQGRDSMVVFIDSTVAYTGDTITVFYMSYKADSSGKYVVPLQSEWGSEAADVRIRNHNDKQESKPILIVSTGFSGSKNIICATIDDSWRYRYKRFVIQ